MPLLDKLREQYASVWPPQPVNSACMNLSFMPGAVNSSNK
ncbi:hypothetical protein ECPA48_0226 [Escherichia coli PA48]|nr:hypothetical protein ECPA48_0226 [Escherichia coli PA48]